MLFWWSNSQQVIINVRNVSCNVCNTTLSQIVQSRKNLMKSNCIIKRLWLTANHHKIPVPWKHLTIHRNLALKVRIQTGGCFSCNVRNRPFNYNYRQLSIITLNLFLPNKREVSKGTLCLTANSKTMQVLCTAEVLSWKMLSERNVHNSGMAHMWCTYKHT